MALSTISLLLMGVYRVVKRACPTPRMIAGATSKNEPVTPFFMSPKTRKERCTDMINDCEKRSKVS